MCKERVYFFNHITITYSNTQKETIIKRIRNSNLIEETKMSSLDTVGRSNRVSSFLGHGGEEVEKHCPIGSKKSLTLFQLKLLKKIF